MESVENTRKERRQHDDSHPAEVDGLLNVAIRTLREAFKLKVAAFLWNFSKQGLTPLGMVS